MSTIQQDTFVFCNLEDWLSDLSLTFKQTLYNKLLSHCFLDYGFDFEFYRSCPFCLVNIIKKK